jgi:hypothetical protein
MNTVRDAMPCESTLRCTGANAELLLLLLLRATVIVSECQAVFARQRQCSAVPAENNGHGRASSAAAAK